MSRHTERPNGTPSPQLAAILSMPSGAAQLGWREIDHLAANGFASEPCGHIHHDPRDLAACRFPRAFFKGGRGDWAVVSLCPMPHHWPLRARPFRTVTLWPARETATRALTSLTCCGGWCCGWHAAVSVLQ